MRRNDVVLLRDKRWTGLRLRLFVDGLRLLIGVSLAVRVNGADGLAERGSARGSMCAEQLGHVGSHFARGRDGAEGAGELLDRERHLGGGLKAFGRIPIES